MRSSCIVSCVPTSNISMRQDHIKAFISRFRKGKLSAFHLISIVIESSRLQSWVGYTTSTEEWPERLNRQAERSQVSAFRGPLCWNACLKETSFLSTSAEGEDKRYMILLDTRNALVFFHL